MTTHPRSLLLAASAWLLGGLGVVMGAVGSHAVDSAQAQNWIRLASMFQMIHALALLMTVQWFGRTHWISYLFLLGMILFCGSLYGLSFTEIEIFRKITPFGGICLIAAWFGAAILSLKKSV